MSTLDKRNPIAMAIRAALFATASVSLTVAPNLYAAEEEEEKEMKVTITGSRISRTDLEGASPINTISTADMQVEGNFTVADALRGSSFNSFGSFSERSGSSAQSQATLDLRGAGSNRTLVLMDGKRMAPSPTLGGQSVNLNSIPFAAVERVEILTDGASSTYGSDAIAGVVNIVMKTDFDGLELHYGAGSRDRDDGLTSREFSIVTGMSNDKGNITFAFDHQDRKGISDGARDYTAAQMNDLNGDGEIQAYTETVGWSIYGATVSPPDFSDAQASPLCDSLIAEYGDDTFARVAADDDWGVPGASYCMYAFANVSYNKASIDRNTVYIDANYEINDDIQWFGRAMAVANSSFGRYAPPAAPWENMAASNPHNPYGVDGAYGFFRWVGIGTRDGYSDDYTQDYITGLKGDTDTGNWEVYFHKGQVDNKQIGKYYLSYGGLAYNQAEGIDLGSEEGIANMKATTVQESKTDFTQYFGGYQFEAFEVGAGSVIHYVGAELIEQSYADIYDGQSETGLIGGSAGNSAAGERDITAVFYEAVLPLAETVEMNLAVRYDDYSDFGDNVAPKASIRWQATDDLVVRASYSEAFRAPGLDELHAATTFSAESAIDYATGATNERQYDTYIKSNSELGPETSDYINFGVAYEVMENLSVKLDYFQLSIEDVIQTKTVQGLLSDEAAGLLTAVAPGTDVSDRTFYLIRATSGALIEAGTGNFNGVGFDIEGIDFTLNGSLETEVGRFSLNWVNSFVLDYTEEVGGILTNTAGWNGQPEYKSNSTLSWSLDSHQVAWNMNYTDSTLEDQPGTPGFQGLQLDSWLIHNLTYSFDTGDYGVVAFGINNVTDEDPVLNSAGQYTNADLYNNYGREYRVNYTINL